MHDFIPRKDTELAVWADNFIRAVGKYAQELEIPTAEVNAITSLLANFKGLLVLTNGQDRTRAVIAKKNEALRALTGKIRAMVRFRLQNPAITGAMRIEMGLNPRDTIRTDHVNVPETVEYNLFLRNIREIIVDFHVKGATNKAKPSGYDGAVIIWDVLAEPPAAPSFLKRHTLASRTPHAIEFTEEERGRTAYVALAWQNERGIMGAWSEIKSAVVP